MKLILARHACFITLVLAGSVLAKAQITADQLTPAQQRDYAWLLLISEPQDVIEDAAYTSYDDVALKGLALPEHLDRRHNLPAFASADPEGLSLAKLVQVATAYRLRHDAAQAAHWYKFVVAKSDNATHIYFYAQALSDSGFTASAKRVMEDYHSRRESLTTTRKAT